MTLLQNVQLLPKVTSVLLICGNLTYEWYENFLTQCRSAGQKPERCRRKCSTVRPWLEEEEGKKTINKQNVNPLLLHQSVVHRSSSYRASVVGANRAASPSTSLLFTMSLSSFGGLKRVGRFLMCTSFLNC